MRYGYFLVFVVGVAVGVLVVSPLLRRDNAKVSQSPAPAQQATQSVSHSYTPTGSGAVPFKPPDGPMTGINFTSTLEKQFEHSLPELAGPQQSHDVTAEFKRKMEEFEDLPPEDPNEPSYIAYINMLGYDSRHPNLNQAWKGRNVKILKKRYLAAKERERNQKEGDRRPHELDCDPILDHMLELETR